MSDWLALHEVSPLKGRGSCIRLTTSFKFIFEMVVAFWSHRHDRTQLRFYVTTVLLKPHVQGINAFDYPSVLREVYPDYYIPLLHGAEDWARAYLLQNNLIG